MYGLAKAGFIHTNNSSYFFYITYYTNVICCMGLPLISIYKINLRNEKVKKEKKKRKILINFNKNIGHIIRVHNINKEFY